MESFFLVLSFGFFIPGGLDLTSSFIIDRLVSVGIPRKERKQGVGKLGWHGNFDTRFKRILVQNSMWFFLKKWLFTRVKHFWQLFLPQTAKRESFNRTRRGSKLTLIELSSYYHSYPPWSRPPLRHYSSFINGMVVEIPNQAIGYFI